MFSGILVERRRCQRRGANAGHAIAVIAVDKHSNRTETWKPGRAEAIEPGVAVIGCSSARIKIYRAETLCDHAIEEHDLTSPKIPGDPHLHLSDF